MARTKNPVKKTSPKRKKSTSKFPGWLSRNKLIVFIIIFAGLGTYLLSSSNAGPSLPSFSDDIIAGYIDMKPTAIARDNNGNISYEMYPSSIYVMNDGTLVCDGGADAGSTVSTAVLKKNEIAKIQRDMAKTDFPSLPLTIEGEESSDLVEFEGILLADGSSAEGTAVQKGAKKPKAFEKAEKYMKKLCDKAGRTQQRAELKAPRQPEIKNDKKTSWTDVTEFITPKASACCGNGTRDKKVENDQASRINAARKAHYRGPLQYTACLSDKAAFHSDAMAGRGSIYHAGGTALGNDTGACHPTWTAAGENVGVGYDSSSLFQAFMNSPGHKANVLDSRWRSMGIGTVRKSDGRIFVTQRFAAYR